MGLFDFLKRHKSNFINFYFLEEDHGFHWLGGDVPTDFKLPESNGLMPFQYLGYVSHMDKTFAYLPFGLHLTFPIYLDIYERLYIDYSNPSAPTLINADIVDDATCAYDDIGKESVVVFEKKFFHPVSGGDYSFGHTGSPNWFQEPEIPLCPKTGKEMKFVCQLGSSPSLPNTKYTNVKTTEGYEQEYFDKMNFWGDGDLFVFFEPESKVACVFIENT